MTDAVYEPAYETYEGQRTSLLTRTGAIAQRSLAKAFRSTWLWILIALTLVHVGIRGVALYATGQGVAPGGQSLFTGEFLAESLATQARWFVTLALVVVGADAIAEDLEAGGLTFHLTKPITKPSYVAGKMAGPLTATLLLTVLPVLVLVLLGVAFTPEAGHPADLARISAALVLAGALVSLTATLVVLALSALLGSRWPAALVWVGIAVILAGAARIVEVVTGEASTVLIDIYAALDEVTRSMAGLAGSQIPEWGAWLAVGGWIAASLAALAWSLHGQEVGA